VAVNQLLRTWRSGRPTFGAWCSSGSPVIAESLVREPFDYICFDLQHGLMGYEGMLSCLQAVAYSAVTPLVRVPSNDVAWIGKALDSGAQGVIIPMINSAEDARRAVANTRLFPLGHRSYGPIRIGNILGRDPATLNSELLCIVMIETAEGVAAVDDICAVDGIDCVYIGPADLGLTLGVEPSATIQPGKHAEACEIIKSSAIKAGKVVGIHCDSGRTAMELAANSYQMLTVGSDIGAVRTQAAVELKAARSEGS
jgi:4-hydroxy-2-oxoheptanedioate aldolase